MLKRLLVTSLLFIFSSIAYCGGIDLPTEDDYDYEIDALAHKAYYANIIFVGLGLGYVTGPNNATVDAALFQEGSVRPGVDVSSPLNFTLINKANFYYTLDIGYKFKPYFGVYFDYNDWGNETLESASQTNVILEENGDFSGALKTFSFGPGVIGYWAIDEGLVDLFAAMGIEFMSSRLNFTVLSPTGENSNPIFNNGTYAAEAFTEVAFLFNFGAEINIDKYVSARLGFKSVVRAGDARIGNLYYNAFYSEMIFHYAI